MAVNQCVDYCLLQETKTTPAPTTTTTASTLFSPSTEYYTTSDRTTKKTTASPLAVDLQMSTTLQPLAGPGGLAQTTQTSSAASSTSSPTSSASPAALAVAAATSRSIFQDVLNMSATMFPPVVTSLSSMSMLEEQLEQQHWNRK